MKRIRILALVLFFLTFLILPVSAKQDDAARDQLDASGAAELFEDLPQETRALFEELGIAEIDFSSLFNTSPRALGEMFLNLMRGKLENPLKAALQILGILILLAVFESFQNGTSSRTSKVMALTSALFFQLSCCPT